MKHIWRAICVAVFVTSVIAFSQTGPAEEKDIIEPAVPFSVVTVESRIGADGAKQILSQRIRYVKANGEWRQTLYRPGQGGEQASLNESPVIASTDGGVYSAAAGKTERKFVSALPDQQMQECFRSVKCLRGQSGFTRVEKVAGLEVYVLRSEIKDANHPIASTETSYSPKTGLIPLRSVTYFRDGSQMHVEATKVEFKDVPDNLNDDVKAMPQKGNK